MKTRSSITATLLLLLGASAGVDAQTYDLRGPAPPPGTIIRTRTETRMANGFFTVVKQGNIVGGSVANEGVSTTELEVVRTDGPRVTTLRLRVAEDWSKLSWQAEPDVGQTTQNAPFVGRTVLIERRDDGWTKTLSGSEPNDQQKPWLREPYFERAEIYPVEPLGVGQTWVVKGEKLTAISGSLQAAYPADGKATFTLDQVLEDGGDRRAVISYRLELRGQMLDDQGVPMDFSLEGNGTIHRSLGSFLDVWRQFSGQQRMEVTRTEGGQEMRVTSGGLIQVESTQEVVSAALRAGIVFRFQAPPGT